MKRVGDLAKIVVSQGLAKTLLPNTDSSNEAACQRVMGMTLSPYRGESFTARTASEQITYRLKKQQSRFGEPYPHNRYMFEEIGREVITDDTTHGVVLEEQSDSDFRVIDDFDLDQYQPEAI